jgi:hypothetical protein
MLSGTWAKTRDGEARAKRKADKARALILSINCLLKALSPKPGAGLEGEGRESENSKQLSNQENSANNIVKRYYNILKDQLVMLNI